MKFAMFSEFQLTEDLPESNLSRGIHAIIVDYCPRHEGKRMARF
ncbi:hypothetical protein [Microcystis aeruginosa]|nr:hypothetical protein [Microcystis aeruginosa]